MSSTNLPPSDADPTVLEAVSACREALDRTIDDAIRQWSGRPESPAARAEQDADPLRRLDVLARHLDGRLRQGRAGSPPDPISSRSDSASP